MRSQSPDGRRINLVTNRAHVRPHRHRITTRATVFPLCIQRTTATTTKVRARHLCLATAELRAFSGIEAAAAARRRVASAWLADAGDDMATHRPYTLDVR